MNSVLANGNTWIGTGNGTGIPIPFPPINQIYSLRPLSLTTVIEDDVFLFNHDYCYKPYNMHPQNKKDILRLIIEWITRNEVWNPSLLEYYTWIEERSGILINVNNDGSFYFFPENDKICIVKGTGVYESI